MEPIVVVDRPERRIRIRLALEDAVLTETLLGSGQHGADPHVHRLHADCFHVLVGAMTLVLADGERVVEAGSFVLVPPHVAHGFRNDGPAALRFLNLHAPGMGFDRYLRGLYAEPAPPAGSLDWFDQEPPPPDGGLESSRVIVRAAEADTVDLGGVRIGFLADAKDTLDAVGLVEYTAPPGFPGPPIHVHDRTWDVYYVLEGRLAVRLGDERRELAAGQLAAVPPGTPHGFSNPFEVPARFLDLYAPGALERYFRESAAAAGGGPPDPAAIAEIAARYDLRPA